MAKSEKDTVRLNSAETRPRGKESDERIGPTGPGPGRNHSSADLLLLISIKFNPARLAVGGAFTSCNSCLPLWSFSRAVPHALSQTPPLPPHFGQTFHYIIGRRNEIKGRHVMNVMNESAAYIEPTILSWHLTICVPFVVPFPLQ